MKKEIIFETSVYSALEGISVDITVTAIVCEKTHTIDFYFEACYDGWNVCDVEDDFFQCYPELRHYEILQ